jgi:dihydroorotate dehydrogenase
MYSFARPLLFRLEPETAHAVALHLLDLAWRCLPAPRLANSAVEVMGIRFPNRVGLAAGLDKNGEHVDGLARLGFGFLEVGTVTPRPQAGNPQPRLFRVPAAQALINRMGFNSLGADRLAQNLRNASYRGVLGINIGKNFDTPLERAAGDYLTCMRKLYTFASYIAVNVSSPNTRDLRRLQEADELDRLLRALKSAQSELAQEHGRLVPIAVKIAPDLSDQQIDAVAALLLHHRIEGVIATNTTVSRAGVEGLAHAQQRGGLSGAPLRGRATAVVRRLAGALRGRIPIIGVGGIQSGTDAIERVEAGASLVQLYTGLIYAGPRLVRECADALARSR